MHIVEQLFFKHIHPLVEFAQGGARVPERLAARSVEYDQPGWYRFRSRRIELRLSSSEGGENTKQGS